MDHVSHRREICGSCESHVREICGSCESHVREICYSCEVCGTCEGYRCIYVRDMRRGCEGVCVGHVRGYVWGM